MSNPEPPSRDMWESQMSFPASQIILKYFETKKKNAYKSQSRKLPTAECKIANNILSSEISNIVNKAKTSADLITKINK